MSTVKTQDRYASSKIGKAWHGICFMELGEALAQNKIWQKSGQENNFLGRQKAQRELQLLNMSRRQKVQDGSDLGHVVRNFMKT